MIVDVLSLPDVEPANIDSQAPLMVNGLGLDSIDALELAMAIGKKYSVKFVTGDPQTRDAFVNVRSLAAFVARGRSPAAPRDGK